MPALKRGEYVDVYNDALFIVGGTIAFLLTRYILINLFFRPLAIAVMDKNSSKKELAKFTKYAWHLLTYICLWIWGFAIMMESDWSFFRTWDIDLIWKGYPHPAPEKLMCKYFMMTQVSWYIHGFFESLIVDAGRSDFILMVIHHVLASVLLCGAFWGNAHRVAVTVCVEQDISDIFLYFSKMIQKSARIPALQNTYLHGFLIWQLLVVWWCTRVGFLGLMVLRCLQIIGPLGLITPFGKDMDLLSMYLIVSLGFFWVMQLFWGLGLVKMCYTQFSAGVIHDIFHDQKHPHKGGDKRKGN
mmetsp:Transcript_6406/g.22906  ORF Transcript_6406/g.22906 Transcript_6406/m.22906 type:complete len:300 (-) Transcript_6406:128-1027(-)